MFSYSTGVVRVNSNSRGQQTAPEVVGLAGGGFVIGWTDQQTTSLASTSIMFQRFDASGAAAGGNTVAAAATSGSEQLTDLLALSNGNFVVGWLSGGSNLAAYGAPGATVLPVARLFDANGTALSADVTTGVLTTGAAQGFELVTSAGGIRGVMNHSAGQLYTLDYTTALSLTNAVAVASSPSASSTLLEAVSSPDGGTALALFSTTPGGSPGRSVFSTAAPASPLSLSDQTLTDIAAMGGDLYTLAGAPSQVLSGTGAAVNTYYVGGAGMAAISGFTSMGSPFAIRHLAYNASTVIEAFAAGFTAVIDGVFQSLGGIFIRSHNLETGITAPTMLIDQTPVGISITGLELAKLTNDQVVVTWSRNGILLNDVFMRVLNFDLETTGSPFSDDSLAGTPGADLLQGLAGNDTLVATTGADTLDGGGGTDRVTYAGSAGPLILDLARPTNNAGAAQDQILIGIEVVEGTAFNDRIIGGNVAERLIGNSGNDLLRSRQGADTLDGGEGGDVLDAAQSNAALLLGGNGDDRMTGGFNADLLLGGAGNDTGLGGGGSDTMEGGAGNDLLDGGFDADLIDGDAGDDRLLGRDGNDTLFGNLGADLLTGLTGNDFMDGEEGNDTALGGAGADTLFGGAGDDQLAGGEDSDVIDTGEGTAEHVAGGAGDDDIIAGAGNDRLLGDAGDDEVNGGAGNDFLSGGSGNDVLAGDLGNDYINGGLGADTLEGGAGNDTLVDQDGADMFGGDGFDFADFRFGDAAAPIRAYLDNFAPNAGMAAGTRFFEVEGILGTALSDTLYGSAAANSIFGDKGDDIIEGWAGDDLLVGGLGGDTLLGGPGNDTIRLDHAGEGVDAVMDFAAGDRILIARAGFANAVNVLITPTAATLLSSATSRFFFDNSGDEMGWLYFDANASDVAGRVLVARIFADGEIGLATGALAATDFILV